MAFEETCNEVAAKGVETELALDNPISFKQVGGAISSVLSLVGCTWQ